MRGLASFGTAGEPNRSRRVPAVFRKTRRDSGTKRTGGSWPLRFGRAGGQLGAQPGFVSRQGRRNLRWRSRLLAQLLKEGYPALVTERHQRLRLAQQEVKASALGTLRNCATDQGESARIILSGRAQQTDRGRTNSGGILRSKIFEAKIQGSLVTESREPAQSRSANRVAPRRRVDDLHQSIVSRWALRLTQRCGRGSDHGIALIVEQLLIRIRKGRILRCGQRLDCLRAHSRVRIFGRRQQR